ncbi:hypothetical protein HPB48_003831 [Haemaphysalis longicornis]|uniref:Calcium uniporter protein C-terminal domain-containing protein n=1 Tax=Haemaphysalis longicornis TaxID=44386 RepID=A0A9J6FBI8_HAELO|nr:hypothetical protein HPB48_003831 [Haemaphysalis longicornis]
MGCFKCFNNFIGNPAVLAVLIAIYVVKARTASWHAKLEVTVAYKDGLPEITVPLPSRRDRCRFTLRPLGSTVGDLLRSICVEDRGVDHVNVTSTERLTSEETQTLSDLKMLVARLYESLTVSEHQLEQERRLLDRLHTVKEQLGPLEQVSPALRLHSSS